MANKASITLPIVDSIQQLGHATAGHLKMGGYLAAKAATLLSGFPEKKDIPADQMAMFNDGVDLAYQENNPAVAYTLLESGAYVPAGKGDKVHNTLTVGYCMGLSTHDFSRLDETMTPQFKGLVDQIRTAVREARNNAFRNLVRSHNLMQAAGDRVRGATKTFDETIKEWKSGLPKKVQAAIQRGDPTAPTLTVVNEAMAAFDAVIAKWKAATK